MINYNTKWIIYGILGIRNELCCFTDSKIRPVLYVLQQTFISTLLAKGLYDKFLIFSAIKVIFKAYFSSLTGKTRQHQRGVLEYKQFLRQKI